MYVIEVYQGGMWVEVDCSLNNIAAEAMERVVQCFEPITRIRFDKNWQK